ncbi:hypothetical protein CEXT_372081 [Caerostris extrusa]|uniref:Uncharacterized protein n=1 Tax=Caerostris extrusa TaxID=172846 RepID=A0AAV4PUL1_CAEEX|nr:hypothetical protein CEXT_372081 [Caerostris extrusa]
MGSRSEDKAQWVGITLTISAGRGRLTAVSLLQRKTFRNSPLMRNWRCIALLLLKDISSSIQTPHSAVFNNAQNPKRNRLSNIVCPRIPPTSKVSIKFV